MAFESSQSEKMWKPKKIKSVSAIAEPKYYQEGFLATPKGQTTFSALIFHHCYGFREGLETLTSFAPANNHCYNFRKGLEILTSSSPTNNYYCGLKKRLETQNFSASTNNHCRSFKERLEIQLVSTTSTSFVSGSDIPKDTPSSIELAETGYTFWHGHCWRSEIKDLISTIHNLYKIIWE